MTVGWLEVVALSSVSQLTAALSAGSLGTPVESGLAAEQRRVDEPGQVGVGVCLPGRKQRGQPPAGAQAGGQVVVGQRGARLDAAQGAAHLLVRLIDERPDPGDAQRLRSARPVRPRPVGQQRLRGGKHAAGHVAELDGQRIHPELAHADGADAE
jgi:hypothetical protein